MFAFTSIEWNNISTIMIFYMEKENLLYLSFEVKFLFRLKREDISLKICIDSEHLRFKIKSVVIYLQIISTLSKSVNTYGKPMITR